MSAFWVVWNPARTSPFVRHKTYEGAVAEAERLAALQPGDEFYALRAVSLSRTVRVETVGLSREGEA